jgi:hypothetical protein
MRDRKPNEIADRVFKLAYGMTAAQFIADIERQRILYVFQQMPQGVPIEHAGVIAARWEGETITSVHGTVFNRYQIANERKLSAAEAIDAGQKNLFGYVGLTEDARVDFKRPDPVLVLLPSGAARTAEGEEVAALHYAYRTLLYARVNSRDTRQPDNLSWMAWVDAQDGALLELTPQFGAASASGRVWRRDPNTPTQTLSFQVDNASGGQYRLQLAGVFNRIDRLGNGTFGDGEVSISSSSGGSTATFANFNQSPINDAANAVCSAGGNNTFRQVNCFAHLYYQRQTILSAGTMPPFPEAAVTVQMDTPGGGSFAAYDNFGSGQSLLFFVLGSAFANAACPNVAEANLPGTQDPTSLMHEFAHLSTPRLQERRPANWCGSPMCMMPTGAGHTMFHDFADAYAQAYASIPCQAGWSRKNNGGVNHSLNCADSDPDGGLPRLSSVGEPFNPASVQDHFPEKRATVSDTDDYANGQIMSTALWLTRAGMRSKCLPSGTAQYFVRVNRALYNYGFLATTCGGIACDRDVYRFAQDFLRQLAQQWATSGQPGGPPGFAHNGAHSTNKLMSGFARTGLFLVPYECIDGDASTGNPGFCPVADGGENGGDAIVDVNDNEPGDDPVVDGVTHQEVDYERRGGPVPTFRVWTGPRFKFNAAGRARDFAPSMATPSPCNTQYRVELASNDTFTGAVNSGWRTVSATANPQCYGTWTPPAATWTPLAGTTGDVQVFYRVRTRNISGGNVKISTQPGNGSFTVPGSYVIVNNLGRP